MKTLSKYPLARMLFPLIGGILFAPILSSNLNLWLFIFGWLAFLFLGWIFFLNKFRSYSLRWISGFLISVLFFFIGLIFSQIQNPLHNPDHYKHFTQAKAFEIDINSAFTETEKTYKCIGKVKAVYLAKDSVWIPTQGKILLYFHKADDFSLQYGDKIISNCQLRPIQEAQNPNAFNYAKYMQRKGIYDQSFLKKEEWKRIESKPIFDLQSLAINLRSKLLVILDNLHYDKENRALAAALLIGYDEYLDANLRSKFAGSGAMHILCVSGLHVGIVYMLSNFLLFFLGRVKYGILIKNSLILMFIWFYALLTGLSPSVMRAATMFSFILLGNSLHRSGNTYNSLAASALLLLLIDTQVIYNIGFQLSYAAVFAILFIQPKISQLFHFKYLIFRKTWDLIAVSIAAQLGTFPLAIYYFHQFPNYFLLTNLWVIPLAFIIVSAGILVLLIGLLGITATLFGKMAIGFLHISLMALNWGVDLINDLPYAVSNKLLLNFFELLLIYLFVFSIVQILLYKKRIFLSPLLMASFLMLGSTVYRKSTNLNSASWVVYHTNGYSAMDFIDNRKSTLIADSAFISDTQAKSYTIKENHIIKRIKENEALYTFPTKEFSTIAFSKNIILFQSLRILFIDSRQKEVRCEKPMDLDYIVIAKNAAVNLKQLSRQYHFKALIFDSSNNWWEIQRLKSEAEALNIEYWDVNEKGAFVIDIKKPTEIQRVIGNLIG